MFSKLEKQVFKKGYRLVAGIDEAGRGSLVGPIAAAITAINPRTTFKLKNYPQIIKDSKQLSKKQREEIFEEIKQEPNIKWKVSFVYPKVIDRINIRKANLLVWQRCLKRLDKQPDFLFLDGKMSLPCLKIKQQSVIKGDQKIFLLSLASIIAKVNRDRLMERLDRKYPEYGFGQHKGYGTKFHLKRIKKFGPSEIHRRSFNPVKGKFN